MAFWIVAINLGILALSMIASHYLAPKATDEAAKAAGLGDFQLPRATEGDVIPLAWGTVRLRSPILTWFGDLEATPIEVSSGALGSDTTIGFRYYLSMRFILCRGNTPVSETGQFAGASFRKLYIGDKEVTQGVTGDFTSGFVQECIDADAPGGGFQGYHYFYRGRWDQTLATASIGTVGNPIDLGDDPVESSSTTPRYRGQVMASVRQWYCGETPSIAPMSWLIYNPVTIPGYEAATAAIGEGDANPAAVLYDILTNPWGGIGSDTSAIDTASFASVAQTLQDEEHGISLAITRAVDARTVIEEVLRQIDGVLYEDPETRQYTLALVREDYTLGSLFVVDEANVIGQPELSSSLWSETVNEVRVIYADPDRVYNDGVATAQDLAHINAQGGRRRSAEFRFPGISNPRLAAYVATRELNFLARPIMKLRVAVNRTAVDLRPGDAFRFQWAAWGLDAVFRVGELEGGTLQDGRIVINAVQDRFAVAGTLLPPADSIADPDPALSPEPVLLRTITEAPRWIQLKAYEAGTIANVDAQHGMFLARPEGVDTRYRVDIDDAGDLAARTFPGYFELDDIYPRSQGPYDTTGIQIRSVTGWTPASATATEIATEGRNLIQIGGEILAFETATFVSGTTWTLDNVWRGVLDTVPADHAEGATGYALPGSYAGGAMGRGVLVHGATVTARTLAATSSTWTPAAESPTDELTARSRVRLPYPVDALTVNGSQAPTDLGIDEGAAVVFAKRDRTKATITRPDAATETVSDGTTYNVVAYKGDGPQDGGTAVTLASGVSSSATTYRHLGLIGHGALEVGIDAALAVALPDGTTPTLGGWQVPTVPIVAPCHRNLIVNGRFSNGTDGWSVTSGSASTGSGSGSLGGSGTMITAAAATTSLVFSQVVPLRGYPPHDLRAVLGFAAGPTAADANDTFAVTITERDSGGATLATHSIAATHPAAWDRYEIDVSALDPDCDDLKIEFTLAIAVSGDGGDTHVDIGVTEVDLHVGQFTSQLLSNPEFASTFTGWTQSVGTWQVLTATLYGSAQYARPNDGASAQLRQAITPATGYTLGATAVLRCGRMNDAVDDTGTVTLQALDGGGTVLDSVTTGAETSSALGGVSAWARRYLALDLPSGTATVRVQLDAARVTGTPLNACFGDFDLRLHKALDADALDLDLVLDAPPIQRLPVTRPEWVAAWPNIAPPNVAMYAGRDVGELGTEPLLEAVGSASMAGAFYCDEGRADDRRWTGCYDLTGGSVQVAAVGASFLNFRSTEDFAIAVAYRVSAWAGSEAGLVARYDGSTVGWEFGIDPGGVPQFSVYGPGGGVTVDGSEDTAPEVGEVRIAIAHYEAAITRLTVIDTMGTKYADVSAAGEFRASDPMSPGAGLSTNFGAFPGQLGRIWAWRGTSTPSASDLASIVTVRTDREYGVDEHSTRTGAIVTVDGSDAAGLQLRTWPVGVAPYTYDDELGPARGLSSSPAATNLLAPSWTGWTTVGGTVAGNVADLTGMLIGRSVVGTSTQGMRSPTIALGSSGTRYFRVCYRAPDAAASFVLEDNSGGTVATQALAQSSTWTIAEFALSWTGATSGNAKVRIAASGTGTSRTCYVSPIMLATSSTVAPAARVIPIGTPGAVMSIVPVSATAPFNSEGELLAEGAVYGAGTIARAWNASNSNDNRAIKYTSGGDIEGRHADSAAGNTTATLTPSGIDTAVMYTARLRWATVGLLDGGSSEFSVIRVEQGATVETATGRSAAWTPSSTALTRVDVGHSDGTDVAAAAIRRIRLRSREPRV